MKAEIDHHFLGNLIYEKRKKLGISQVDLARRLKVNHHTIIDIERGRQYTTSFVKVLIILKSVGVTSKELTEAVKGFLDE